MNVDRRFAFDEEPFRSLSPPLRILIPAYNESQRITHMLIDYCTLFQKTAIVTVIANACADDTVPVIEGLMQRFSNLQLVVINARIGKGGAIRAGLNIGDEKYVGFVDADGSTDAAEFARLFRCCEEEQVDGVIGSRWLPDSVVYPKQSLKRRVASRGFNAIVRALFGLPYTDTQCGAKVFRRNAIRAVLPSLELANFAFDIDLLFNMKQRGFQVIEVATRWSDSIGTKVRLFSSALTMLQAVARLRLQESWLFRLPFADMFGCRDVIPVKEGTRILVIGNRYARGWAVECVETLREAGCRLTWNDEVGRSKLGLIFWYLFKSSRQYDAIVEIASGWPSVIPLFSAKRCFLIQDLEAQARLPARLFALLYRPVHRLCRSPGETIAYSPLYGAQPLDDATPKRAAAYIVEQIGAGVLYSAEFQHVGDAWELHFSDLDSGSWTLKSLK
jgi:glycosyltransferase involved in cell wall biosynthesis